MTRTTATTASPTGRQVISATLARYAAHASALPIGVLVAAYLSRRFGPEGYGLYSLAASVTLLLALTIGGVLSRPTIRHVSAAPDARAASGAALWLYVQIGLVAAVGLALASPAIARSLGAPVLTGYLRLFALVLPIFAAASAHAAIAIGQGYFVLSAVAMSFGWIARLVVSVGLVEAGMGIPGAILGWLGTWTVQLVVIRRFVKTPWSLLSAAPMGTLARQGLLFVPFTLSLRFIERADILALKLLGGSVADAGIYSAGHSLALAMTLFGPAFGPVLLATLARLAVSSQRDDASRTATTAVRAVVALLPFAAAIAVSSDGIVNVVFGARYAAAAKLLAVLSFASIGFVMIHVTAAILTAAGRPDRISVCLVPAVPLAVLGYLLLIPSFGPAGAALTTLTATTGAACALALTALAAWDAAIPWATLLRSLAVALLVSVLGRLWPAPGLSVVAKLVGLAAVILASFYVLGEVDDDERALLRSLLPRSEARRPVPPSS